MVSDAIHHERRALTEEQLARLSLIAAAIAFGTDHSGFGWFLIAIASLDFISTVSAWARKAKSVRAELERKP